MALQPLAKSLLQNNPLCEPCRACVSRRPRKYDDVVSTSMGVSAMMHAEEERKSPKHSHCSYKTFDTAVQNGCYICNTIVENFLSEPEFEDNLTLENDFERIDFKLEWLPQMVKSYSVHPVPRLLYFTLRFKSSETRVLSRFIHETSNVRTACVMPGATDSDVAFRFAKHQLSRCIEDHDCVSVQSKQTQPINRYPTRLVDVGSSSSDRTAVKAIETATTRPEGPYLTLSHCWGDASLVTRLTTETKAVFFSELPRLSRTFEEAISVTKRLGARYIWIDSLCIIQNDSADWAQESMLMASIYRNALCNLAATASEDSQGGLIRQRGEHLPGTHISNEFLWSLDPPQYDVLDTESSPLQKRGWVLQERLLSPRVLHFSDRQLIWECKQLRASELFPEGYPATLQYFFPAPLPLGEKAQQRYSGSPELFLRDWGAILKDFITRRLSYKSDLLPAVAGIAEHLREHTGHTYMAGIFRPEQHFEAHLAWYCVSSDAPRPTELRAPSWSWASTDNPIVLSPGTSSDTSMEEDSLKHSVSKVEISDVQVHPHSISQRSCDRILVVEGFLIKAKFSPDSGEVMVNARTTCMQLFLDEPCVQERDVYILPLLQLNAFHPDFELGTDKIIYIYLILVPWDDQDTSYVRLGLGRFECTDRPGTEEDQTASGICFRVENNLTGPSHCKCEDYIGYQTRRQISIR